MSDTAYYFSEFGPSDDERTAQALAAEAAAGYPQDWRQVERLVEAAKAAAKFIDDNVPCDCRREYDGSIGKFVTCHHLGCSKGAALAALEEAGIK